MSNASPPVGYLLKQAQSLLHARMEEAFAPLQLTVSHYSCLYHLRLDPGISASTLARRTFVTRQSMNVMLQQLVDRGLVERPTRADGGRALPAELTPGGVKTLDDAQALADGVEQRMLADLTPSDTAALARALAACVSALSE
jgi:DNA-binding MarR family transcriptional regulator